MATAACKRRELSKILTFTFYVIKVVCTLYNELICQSKSRKQSEAKIVCQSAITIAVTTSFPNFPRLLIEIHNL